MLFKKRLITNYIEYKRISCNCGCCMLCKFFDYTDPLGFKVCEDTRIDIPGFRYVKDVLNLCVTSNKMRSFTNRHKTTLKYTPDKIYCISKDQTENVRSYLKKIKMI